jgi:hypothetical protein
LRSNTIFLITPKPYTALLSATRAAQASLDPESAGR